MTINIREQDELWVPDGYDNPENLEALRDEYESTRLGNRARADAIADFTASCERTVRGGRCTGCEEDSLELIPWSGERLCWACVDVQLDLMAAAILEEGR
jgi:hypothetical protein